MHSRQGLVEQFSTFLQLEAERFSHWATDPRLRRSMQRNLDQLPQSDPAENFWALYWHKNWQTQTGLPQTLAQNHLAAYVQESCYWVAQKTSTSFTSTRYSLADCFQMAIAGLDRVLKGFDSQQGFNFKNYASATFNSLIRERLRQRQEVDICTDWALLRKLSQRRLTESLQAAGLSDEAIASSVLAWTGFKTFYVPTQASGTRKLPKPEAATWEAIAQFYNQERHQLTTPGTAATPETLEKWLLTCAKSARAYLYPNQISINTAKGGDSGGEFLDDLPEMAATSGLDEMLRVEAEQTRQAQQAELNQVLMGAIARLDSQSQTLLELYYRQELTQQQMAAQMEMKQYTISRRLSKAREQLLLALAKWGQETLHIPPTPDVLKYTSMALEEWLQLHFGHPDRPASDSIQVKSSS